MSIRNGVLTLLVLLLTPTVALGQVEPPEWMLYQNAPDPFCAATEIGADVFLGSDTMLVAPIKLEDGSRTGAGSVVTKNVPADTLVAGVPARAIRKLKKND